MSDINPAGRHLHDLASSLAATLTHFGDADDAVSAKANLWRVAELAHRPLPTSKDVDEMSVRMESAYASLFALFIASERLIEVASDARVAKDRLVAQSKTHDQDEDL
jgi:hypothetical protein